PAPPPSPPGPNSAAAHEPDKAEHAYLDALKLGPQSELILTDLAVTYELQGRTDKAIELYQRILALNPQSVPVRRRLAGIYAGQKKFDEALSQFQALEQT